MTAAPCGAATRFRESTRERQRPNVLPESVQFSIGIDTFQHPKRRSFGCWASKARTCSEISASDVAHERGRNGQAEPVAPFRAIDFRRGEVSAATPCRRRRDGAFDLLCRGDLSGVGVVGVVDVVVE